MSVSKHHRPASAGFTLLELLVAIALLGLIATLLVAGLQLGTASRDRVAQQSRDLEDQRVIETFLRQRLVQALPFVSESRRDLPRVRFEGSETEVRFLVPSVFRDETRGVRELRVKLDGDPGSKSLVVYDAPWNADNGPTEVRAERHILVDAVTTIAFSYYGANPPQSKARWHRDWRDGAALPALIRMEVKRNAADPPWPEITVAPVLKREDR